MKKTAAKPKRSRLSAEQRREDLLRTGMALFTERSIAELTLDDICKRTGVSRQLVHHYFGTKHGFFIETLRYGVGQLAEYCSLPPGKEHFEVFLNLIERFFTFVRSHPAGATISLQQFAGKHRDVEAVLQPYRERIFNSTVTALGVSEPDAPTALAVWGWLGYLEMTASQLLDRPSITSRQAAEAAASSLFSLLRNMHVAAGIQIPKNWAKIESSVRAQFT